MVGGENIKIQDEKFAKLINKENMILILERYINLIETGVTKKYGNCYHDINDLKKILEEIKSNEYDHIFYSK